MALKRPTAVPASVLTAGFCYQQISLHLARAKAPISVSPKIFISIDDVPNPKAEAMSYNSIYIVAAADGATINTARSQRRLQKFVCIAWAVNRDHAAIGGQVITQALKRYGQAMTESAVEYNEESKLYSVRVRGFFSTRLSGAEMLY